MCSSEFCVFECFMSRLNWKSDLANYKVYGEPLKLDRVNILLHVELVKVAGCSEQSIHI